MRSEIRHRAYLTLQELSNATGIPASTLSQWECGTRKLTDEQMRAIARVLAEHFGNAQVFLGGANELFRVIANPASGVAA